MPATVPAVPAAESWATRVAKHATHRGAPRLMPCRLQPGASALTLALVMLGASCASKPDQQAPTASPTRPAEIAQDAVATGRVDMPAASAPATKVAAAHSAAVIAVRASGDANGYRFAVRVRSPDSGCERYANYWEVLRPAGELVYRRLLAHAHIDEQPFTRSGGPVEIAPEDEVIVRAHLHPHGYGGQAMRGSVSAGFAPTQLPPGFASDALKQGPQPQPCAF